MHWPGFFARAARDVRDGVPHAARRPALATGFVARFRAAFLALPMASLMTSLMAMAAPAHGANPFIPAGDLSLRHDIQLLADAGIVRSPVTSWPLAWAPLVADLAAVDAGRDLPLEVTMALARVRERAALETRARVLEASGRLAATENPSRLRSFADTPRESGEAELGISWLGDRVSLALNAQAVASPEDDRQLRADGSMLAVAVGNFSLAASTLDRWWGPGWDGSLILSANARPIPALTIDRVLTDPFRTRWLRWLGPWDVSVMFGQLESARAVPDARFFGLRFNFRPVPSLEIGLSRTAQWCGEGRPCDAGTFYDLLIGRDNRGSDGIDPRNEPGNQLAGVDARWSASLFGVPFAAYGQFIGEDEAGGLPSRYLVQSGVETHGTWNEAWSYRLFVELAGTSCDFIKQDLYNCGYNHSIYESGYRYRGRVIGHPADNDARLFSAGLMLSAAEGGSWWAVARAGELNRGGPPDPRQSLTPTPQDIVSLDLHHARTLPYGVLEIGAGIERIDDAASPSATTDGRFFIQWRSPASRP